MSFRFEVLAEYFHFKARLLVYEGLMVGFVHQDAIDSMSENLVNHRLKHGRRKGPGVCEAATVSDSAAASGFP